MIFTNKYNFGVTQKTFLNEFVIAYLNLCKAKTSAGYTVCTATSIDMNTQNAIKKCYSEYLERFSMGIPVDKNITINTIDVISNNIKNNLLSEFGYGNHEFGHNDTTGTAAGINSSHLIQKAICELVEKNEVLCFWYGRSGKVIETTLIQKIIDSLGFVSTDFYCFLLDEISNFPTIIILGFYKKQLITTGVCCSNSLINSIYAAFQEARIIEWQQFSNQNSNFTNYSNEEQKIFFDFINNKQSILKKQQIYKSNEKVIKYASWVGEIQLRLLYTDNVLGVKVIKCISDSLLSSLPITNNILKSSKKEIIKRYYIDREVDCPIV